MTAKEQLLEIVDACSEVAAEEILCFLDERDAAIAAGNDPPVFRPDLSAEAINRRLGLEPVSAEVFEQHFGHLPTDDEG
jgi:hypothetical protein